VNVVHVPCSAENMLEGRQKHCARWYRATSTPPWIVQNVLQSAFCKRRKALVFGLSEVCLLIWHPSRWRASGKWIMFAAHSGPLELTIQRRCVGGGGHAGTAQQQHVISQHLKLSFQCFLLVIGAG